MVQNGIIVAKGNDDATNLPSESDKLIFNRHVEHSAKNFLAECSTSFRIGFRRWPFLPIIGLLVPACINEMERVAAKCECFGGSFQMLRVDIPLSPKIRPLQRRRHQLHEVVHDHAPTFLWIEQR